MKRFFILIMIMAVLVACPSKKTSEDITPTPEPTPVPMPTPEPVPDPNTTNPYIYVRGNRFYFQGKEFLFKGVNYYPSRNSWRRMWEVWDSGPIDQELGLLEAIGVNVVRVFLDYNLFEKHRVSRDYSIMLVRLDELLSIIGKHKMRALITPFVWGRGGIATDRLHIQHIASRYAKDPRVFGWDISNELDHCWIDDPSKKRAAIQQWAVEIMKALRETDKNHLATVGDYGWYLGNRDDPYGSGISLDLSRMSIPAESQDFICFHWYSHYYALDVALSKLAPAISKPIVIEELGLPTGGVEDSNAVWYLNETQVAGYYRAWLEVATKHGAYLMPWCGFDYEPGIAPFAQNSNQLFFGLYATDYRLKANGDAFRDGAAAAIKLKISSLPVIKECRRKDK
jgi:hypothetical protein